MQYLEYTHNYWLVIASLLVAILAGFTGLSLTQGLSKRSFPQRSGPSPNVSGPLRGQPWSRKPAMNGVGLGSVASLLTYRHKG